MTTPQGQFNLVSFHFRFLLIFAAAGWVSGGDLGLKLFTLAYVLLWTVLARQSQNWILNRFDSSELTDPELVALIEQCCSARGISKPTLRVVSRPDVWSLPLRSMGSSGVILLSRGTLSFLSHLELVRLLEKNFDQICGLSGVVRTFCRFLALKMDPSEDTNPVIFENHPLSWLRRVVSSTWADYFQKLAQG
jgi:hypothetical protein